MNTPPGQPAAIHRHQPILAEDEAARRRLQLAELQTALTALGVHSVLARNHQLVLQYNRAPSAPSGLTDPRLHILGSERSDSATTDGTTYTLASGPQYPAADPATAATAISKPAR